LHRARHDLATLPRTDEAEGRCAHHLHGDRGTLLASPGLPPFDALVWASRHRARLRCAATINHVLDRRIDGQMARTRARPLPTGQLTEQKALVFAAVLAWLGCDAGVLVNLLTAGLTFVSLIGYAVIYTVWLKRATSQKS